jgi:hypothetical protein
LGLLAHFALAGVDVGRFHWSGRRSLSASRSSCPVSRSRSDVLWDFQMKHTSTSRHKVIPTKGRQTRRREVKVISLLACYPSI